MSNLPAEHEPAPDRAAYEEHWVAHAGYDVDTAKKLARDDWSHDMIEWQAKEIEQLRLDLAQQAINASTIIEQQKEIQRQTTLRQQAELEKDAAVTTLAGTRDQLRECERALDLYSAGTSEYFGRHPLRDDVGDKHGD